MKRRRVCACLVVALLLLGLTGNFTPQVEMLSSLEGKSVESAAYVDLNALMFGEF